MTALLCFVTGLLLGCVCGAVGVVSVVWAAISVAAEWETDEGAGE